MPAPPSPPAAQDARNRLRIGLLTDPRSRPWVMRVLARWAHARPDMAIVCVSVDPMADASANRASDGSRAGFPGAVSRGLFRVLRCVESRLIGRVARDLAPLTESGSACGGQEAVRVAGGHGVGERIARLGLDLIVSIGPHALGDELYRAARLGSVSVAHDGEFDGSIETGGFWQVVDRVETTSFVVTGRRPGQSAPSLLRQGNVRNRFSFLYNQIALHKKSLHALQKVLVEIAARGGIPDGGRAVPAVSGPARGPTVSEQLAYFGRFVRAALARVLGERGIGRAPRWGVRFAPVGWSRLDMTRAIPIPNPKNAFLADPFLLEDGGRTFCFVEELVFKEGRGCIAAYELHERGAVRIGRVIEEPFHMSFPYVFRHAGEIYMVPETSEHRDVRVYRCTGLPDRWELAKVLMTDLSTADTMIFEHGGRWWLLTNLDPAETGDFCSELHLFHADGPLSDTWTPHPMNPVLTDARRARNGGLLRDGDAIYRVSQRQAFDTYGSGFAVNRIDVLTPDDYAEVEVFADEPDRFRRPGPVHHVHSTGNMSVFDLCRRENVRH